MGYFEYLGKAANSTKTAPGILFKPGESGNPNGRPKTPQEIIDAFRAKSMDAVNTLFKIMEDEGAKSSDRVKAADIVLNRAYGTAPQSVTLNGVVSTTHTLNVSELTPEQQQGIIALATATKTSND